MKVKSFMYQSIWLGERSLNFAIEELKHLLVCIEANLCLLQTLFLILLHNVLLNPVPFRWCTLPPGVFTGWVTRFWKKNYPNTKTAHHRGDSKPKLSSVWNKHLTWEYTSWRAWWDLLVWLFGPSTTRLKLCLYCWIGCAWGCFAAGSPCPCC